MYNKWSMFQSKVMLKGLSAIPEVEIVGVENPIDFANRVYKNKYTAPTVLIFKYNYVSIKNAIQVLTEISKFNLVTFSAPQGLDPEEWRSWCYFDCWENSSRRAGVRRLLERLGE